MKKCILLTLTFILILLMPLTTVAEGNMSKTDSLNISSNERSRLVLQNPNGQIVKKYVAAFCFLFPGTSDTEELIQSEEILDEQYMIFEGNSIVSYQTLRTGKTEEVEGVSKFERASDEEFVTKMKDSKTFLAKISADIQVHNLYYFVDTTHLGSCIYFDTNKGNYVYYRGLNFGDGKEYLFPAEKFIDLVTLIYTERSQNSNQDGGNVDINDYMDVSRYVVGFLSTGANVGNNKQNEPNSANTTTDKVTFCNDKIVLWVSVGCFVAISTIILFVLLIKHIEKDKRREKNKSYKNHNIY